MRSILAYQKAGKKERVEIEVRFANHDRLVPVTGMNRSYLATRLRTYKAQLQVTAGGETVKVKAAKPKRGKKRAAGGGRKPVYDTEFTACLARIWEFYDQPCVSNAVATAAGSDNAVEHGIPGGMAGVRDNRAIAGEVGENKSRADRSVARA